LTDPDWALPLEPAPRPVRVNGDLDPSRSEPPSRTAREAMVDSMQAVRSPPAARRSLAAAPDAPPAQEISAPTLTPPPAAEVNQRAPAPEPRRTPSLLEAQRLQSTSEPTSQTSDVGEAKRAAATTPRATQSDENSLAEMAQRLEAALRRPTKPGESAAPPSAPARSPVRPESPPSRKPVVDAVNASKGTVKVPEQASAPPPDLKVLPGKAKAEPKTEPPPESLEDEMAKMLGRSPAK
jgi:hypothetical protein